MKQFEDGSMVTADYAAVGWGRPHTLGLWIKLQDPVLAWLFMCVHSMAWRPSSICSTQKVTRDSGYAGSHGA